MAGIGIGAASSQHTAHFVLRIHLMGNLCSQSRGHQLMVSSLVLHLFLVFAFLEAKTCPHKRSMQNHINFIKGQPVPNQPLIATENRVAQIFIKGDHFSTPPCTVFPDQVHRTIEMGNGHQRLNPIFMALFEDIFVEFQSFFIGFRFISLGENTAPGNAHSVHLESHLSKQADVLGIAMVHVDGLFCGIEMLIIKIKHFHFPADHCPTICPNGGHIHICQASASLLEAPFTLVGSCGSTP